MGDFLSTTQTHIYSRIIDKHLSIIGLVLLGSIVYRVSCNWLDVIGNTDLKRQLINSCAGAVTL